MTFISCKKLKREVDPLSSSKIIPASALRLERIQINDLRNQPISKFDLPAENTACDFVLNPVLICV